MVDRIVFFEKVAWSILSLFSSVINSLSANPTKWSNTLKQFLVNLPTNILSELDHLPLKGLTQHFERLDDFE